MDGWMDGWLGYPSALFWKQGRAVLRPNRVTKTENMILVAAHLQTWFSAVGDTTEYGAQCMSKVDYLIQYT